MERLLITGVDRPLGACLAQALSDRCEVLGLYSDYAVECDGVHTAYWPGQDALSLSNHWHQWQPHGAIHCGQSSHSSWDVPLLPPTATDDTAAALALADLAAESHARLAVVSTDLVFAGPRMFHEETSPATAASLWAARARNVENALRASHCLVVRTHAFGRSPVPAHAGFAERAVTALLAGEMPVADGLRHATPLYAGDLAVLLWRAFELRLQGLYHLAGAERTSPYRFVLELASLMGATLPPGGSSPWLSDNPVLNEETSLNSKRARRALEMATPLLREGLQRFIDQGRSEWRTLGRIASREAAA